MPKKKQSTLDAFRNFDKHTQRATQLATSPTKSNQATQAAATHAKKVIGAVYTSAKVSRKRRSVKRKVSRKRRSVKRKVSRKRRSVKRKVSRKRRSVKRKVSPVNVGV